MHGGEGAGAQFFREVRSMSAFSDRDFARFSQMIYQQCGINLRPHKKEMLEARLRKRLRMLGVDSFSAYADYVFSEEGRRQELAHLIDVVTTNKTDFFREPAHFAFLQHGGLADLVEHFGIGVRRRLRAWSAACSSGEEPYTLAMVLSEFGRTLPGFDYSILATDVSGRVLDAARLGVYGADKVEPVPEPLRRRYLLRSRDPERRQLRIAPELRARVEFRHLNFMDPDWGLRDPPDLIFCRNVLIYFDRSTQQRLLERFCHLLPQGRYLFLGHSESLHGMGLPLTQMAPSIYRRN